MDLSGLEPPTLRLSNIRSNLLSYKSLSFLSRPASTNLSGILIWPVSVEGTWVIICGIQDTKNLCGFFDTRTLRVGKGHSTQTGCTRWESKEIFGRCDAHSCKKFFLQIGKGKRPKMPTFRFCKHVQTCCMSRWKKFWLGAQSIPWKKADSEEMSPRGCREDVKTRQGPLGVGLVVQASGGC